MLSEETNIKGPQLVNITHAVLQNFGIQIDNNKMSMEVKNMQRKVICRCN
jgi:5-enolpyruvylshikimate-3-phosphate synthase